MQFLIVFFLSSNIRDIRPKVARVGGGEGNRPAACRPCMFRIFNLRSGPCSIFQSPPSNGLCRGCNASKEEGVETPPSGLKTEQAVKPTQGPPTKYYSYVMVNEKPKELGSGAYSTVLEATDKVRNVVWTKRCSVLTIASPWPHFV